MCVWKWMYFFFVMQKTAYEMRISDWSSDVCSSDRRAGVERVDNEARLARARQAGDAGEGAERDRRGDTPKVVRPRALQHQVEAVARAAVRRNLDTLRAGQIGRGQAAIILQHLFQRPLGHDLAAMDPRAGAPFDDKIGMTDTLTVIVQDRHRN